MQFIFNYKTEGMSRKRFIYELFTITELPNNELTSIHTRNLPPLLLQLLMSNPLYFRVNCDRTIDTSSINSSDSPVISHSTLDVGTTQFI